MEVWATAIIGRAIANTPSATSNASYLHFLSRLGRTFRGQAIGVSNSQCDLDCGRSSCQKQGAANREANEAAGLYSMDAGDSLFVATNIRVGSSQLELTAYAWC